jgi:hypothetical protein
MHITLPLSGEFDEHSGNHNGRPKGRNLQVSYMKGFI